ncbi:transglycosylase SLT domain-containing protein [Geobacter sp. SVR]|uniref:transglycosylase SLT domain-containing protein n=1 Tax=Geobacter sp. SVR TaxID=2495594 RepID=UPI00143F018A|nr:transglycosylase SLT domain-containing protein [Geobacter sp. SVR]BCS55862.1 lytic transglycosylase [Geobacter sp. SVR]GCF83866.1 lytic transglycosylase [Geobacter sp. SVR]
MPAKSLLTSLIVPAALLLCVVPVRAVEPTQALLGELTRPTAPMQAQTPELVALDDPQGEEEQSAGISDFFTLEELKGKPGQSGDLMLPDLDLPLSDIPLTLNNKVEYFLYYFQTKGKPSFSRWLSRSSRYIPMMKEILKRQGMPEDLVYVAMIESGFHLHARSWANAVGPWQFVSDTGRRYSLRIDQWVDERKDPVKATSAAALYLKELYEMFNGDWYLAAAGYNAGENKILRAIGMYNTSDFWEISRGSYLKRETKEYVPKLLAAAIIAKEPARYGFSDIAYLPPIEFETVTIPTRTDLELVAKLAGTTYDAIRDLNPDLRHWCTPPNYPDYQLKLPKGTRQRFETEYGKVPAEQRFSEKTLYTRYQARKKDSLKSVARRFGITPETLSELNGLSKKSRIAGRSLIVPVKQTVDFGHEGRSAGSKSGKGTFAKYYVVKKGDTLASLSKQFNVSTKLLSAWNNLKGKIALKPGRRIIIARFTEKNGQMVPAGSRS